MILVQMESHIVAAFQRLWKFSKSEKSLFLCFSKFSSKKRIQQGLSVKKYEYTCETALLRHCCFRATINDDLLFFLKKWVLF
jgi:hypothetical protein